MYNLGGNMDNTHTNLPDMIRQKYNRLTETQKKIADFILKNEENVAFLTVDRCAAQIGVSASSVTRFATELGYNGYPDLQNNLRQTLQQRLNPTHRLASGLPHDENQIYSASIQKDIMSIEETFKLNSSAMMEAAVKALKEAGNIYLVGHRSSYSIISYFSLILEQMLGNVTVINKLENMTPEYLLRMKKDDLLVSISFPRYNLSTVKFTEQASDRGLKILAISDSLSSPLLQFTDVYLLSRFESISFYNSYVSTIALINCICAELAVSLREHVKERLIQIDNLGDNTVIRHF